MAIGTGELVGAALSLLVLAGAALALRTAWRAPRCAPCGVVSEALATPLSHTLPAVVEIVYRCPRCRQVLGRRRFGEWE
jgi:predicted RNA-binding Zn-ribbon protein involved in translation (DUF1610 family)